jgi:non-specific serine/threonine protein kinase
LATKNLVRALGGDEGVPRFGLLETIRDFASEQLRLSGELNDARRRHAEYYLDLARQLQAALRGPEMAGALETVQAEYDNFREVFLWSASDDGDLSVGLRLAGALYRFWIMRGQLAEARQWLEPALARASEAEPQVYAVALNAAGTLAHIQQDHARAVELHEQSLRLWTELGDGAGMAGAHLNLGFVAHDQSHLERALDEFVLAEQLYTELEDRDGLGRAIGSQARIAREQGDLQRAMALLGRSLQLFRDVGDEWLIANTLANLGDVMLALGDSAGAEDLYRQALHIRRRLGSVLGVAECLEGFAKVFAERHARRAARLLGAAESLREVAGAPLPTPEQTRYADLTARVRGQLREDMFASAWAQGRAASMEEAIALALRSEPATAEHATPPEAPADGAAILTRREREVAELIAAGRSNREIAEALVVAVKTVDTHVEHIFRKLGVQTRAEVAVWAAQHGLLPARSG